MKPSAALSCLIICLAASTQLVGCESRAKKIRHQDYAFGTLLTIDFFGADSASDELAMTLIQKRRRDIDLNWYPWREQDGVRAGELQNINAAIAAGRSIEVSPVLAELIRRAQVLERKSGGAFNPAIGHLTELWGFHDAARMRSSPPKKREIDEWLAASVSSTRLQWNANGLRSSSRDVMLDLGGIAKGSILEQFAAIVRRAGIANAIIDIGGDLTVMGRIGDRPARIGIRSPRSDGVLAWLEVADGETVMTSGDYERFFEYQGQRYQHILDPRTGYPVQDTISATVVHEDAVLADAAATALLVGGAKEFEQLCASLGIDTALLVGASGDLRLTRKMEKRLHWPDR